jgi:hypothetical protein
MTSRDFCYWLQGLFELAGPETLSAKQTDLVKRHLALVFKHEIDPSMGPPAHQAELNAVHSAKQTPSFDSSGLGGPVMRC